jgi:hypothetical protein
VISRFDWIPSPIIVCSCPSPDDEYQHAHPPAEISADPPDTDRTLSVKQRLFWASIGATAVVLYRLVRGRSRL